MTGEESRRALLGNFYEQPGWSAGQRNLRFNTPGRLAVAGQARAITYGHNKDHRPDLVSELCATVEWLVSVGVESGAGCLVGGVAAAGSDSDHVHGVWVAFVVP